MKYGQNLTETWILNRLAAGYTKTQAMRQLQQLAGGQLTLSRINEWIRGGRSPTRTARIAMLWLCMDEIERDMQKCMDYE